MTTDISDIGIAVLISLREADLVANGNIEYIPVLGVNGVS
jgi:hypothetical protein